MSRHGNGGAARVDICPERNRLLRPLDGSIRTLRQPRHAARRAQLIYVSDQQPGFRRVRRGKGYRYIDPDGAPVGSTELAERISALAIPPAWTDVWIAADPFAHIQATGRDQKGRKQYRYHPAWIACRDEAKFSTLAAFARKLPLLRLQAEEDLQRRGLNRRRVIASIVVLLDDTMIRIGNDIYARQNRSYGLSTLRQRHVAIEGSEIRFSFIGKSGQEWNVSLRDRRLAYIVRSLQELPGQRLFQHIDEHGTPVPVLSQDINAYIQEALGPEFTSKHFRTWGASKAAAAILAETPLPESKRQQTTELNACIDKVARRLRNTRSVCRRCYIHPRILETWLSGRLGEELAALAARGGRVPKGLDKDEALLLRWLEQSDPDCS